MDLEALRDALSQGGKQLRITAHAQVEGFKDGLELKEVNDLTRPFCGGPTREGSFATQVYERGGATLTLTGISAVRICTRCDNAVLEWDVAQQVQDLVKVFFKWVDTHTLSQPVATIVFPKAAAA